MVFLLTSEEPPVRIVLSAALAAAFLVSACRTTEPAPTRDESAAQAAATASSEQTEGHRRVIDPTRPMPPGIDESAMDTSVDPCEDFYQYACGSWLKNTEIPADRAAWSRGFASIAERNEKILHDLLDEIAQGKPPEGTPYAQQLGDFYATCMDEPKLESGLAELKKQLVHVEKVKDAESLLDAVAWMHARGMSPLFQFGSTPDLKRPDFMIAEFHQGGLGLPDRDYYVKDDPKMKQVRDNYRAHVAKMFELFGQKPAQAQQSADAVMDLETKLAQVSLTRVEMRDPKRLYNKLDREGLEKTAPGLPWGAFLATVGVPDVKDINIAHPPFFAEVSKLAKEVKPVEWRTYLTWVFIRETVPALPGRFQQEHFAFVSQNLSGAKVDLPRWKKCVSYTDQLLGEALAVPFVKKYFGEEGKKTTLAMVQQIEKEFEKDLDSLSWMDDQTRERARQKLRAITNKIGYPEKWKQYDALETDRSSFLANWLRANEVEAKREVNKIGKPVDKTEWFMTPPTVNAYYNPPLNEIVFPAGILQPPFFDIHATDPVNFGAMGMVMGHETTHGFDDEGRQFDFDGSLNDWWTEASAKAFAAKAECVKNRYSQEIAVDDLHVNGALTLGENIADMGGLKLAHAAMRSWQAQKKQPAAGSYRYDDDQQFFLGFAQSWCNKYRPENARMRVTVDPHSPPPLRVNVPLSNLPAFQEAFQCKPGQKMAKPAAERCEVW
ncbi:MAG: M13 family metallopeptidase [Myxococcaceae bacterium]|nr:M13 family metallopeptidase [Myxococcaceae bacterium]